MLERGINFEQLIQSGERISKLLAGKTFDELSKEILAAINKEKSFEEALEIAEEIARKPIKTDDLLQKIKKCLDCQKALYVTEMQQYRASIKGKSPDHATRPLTTRLPWTFKCKTKGICQKELG